MVLKSSLEKAAQQNIIKAEQVEPLYQLLKEQSEQALPEKYGEKYGEEYEAGEREEPLKFIRSFGDIFITLGIVLLIVAINRPGLTGYYSFIPVAGFVVVAEWLVRVRKLALPGMAILLAILYFMNKAITFESESATVLSMGVLSVTSLAFYLRYKMPFSLLPLAASLVAMVIIQTGLDVIRYPIVFAVFGLLVFVVALYFDSRDTLRQSYLSDSAFWLHLLAGPLMVHGLMVTMLTADQSWMDWLGTEWVIIAFFAGFFLLALLVDRRSILISTQLYMIYALAKLFQDSAAGAQDVMVYILIALGLFVIYFGAYWYKTRRLIFGFLSSSFIARYVPDFKIQDVNLD
ncbi:hypothetical protein MNBD_GAMMA10-175 [hydrothermal vent metagenome]|uniref:DUF2157 domain-containing protein n=1 Tax=hydrothermal vent metagenome TaxID=652676 RepID=A0A3B0XGX4_9ZZZZ